MKENRCKAESDCDTLREIKNIIIDTSRAQERMNIKDSMTL